MDAEDRIQDLRADLDMLEHLRQVAAKHGDVIMAAAVNEVEAERLAELRRVLPLGHQSRASEGPDAV